MNSAKISAKTSRSFRFSWLPILPVVFFFLHNANNYMELLLSADVLILFLIYAVLALTLFFLCRFLMKLSRNQSLFISTIAITCFLSFGAIQDFLFRYKKFPFISNSLFLLAIMIIGLLTAIIYLKRRKIEPVNANFYLKILFPMLIGLEFIFISIKVVGGNTMNGISSRMISQLPLTGKTMPASLPDIYQITFDEYTNAPALREFWDYDDEIYPYLASKGFYIVDSASSNYKSTPFSMASLFNMQYINGANPWLTRNSMDFYMGWLVYRQNILFKFLKERQYALHTYCPFESNDMLAGLGVYGIRKPARWIRDQTMERIYLNPWLLNKVKSFFGEGDRQPASVIKDMHHFELYNQNVLSEIMLECENTSKQNPAHPVFCYTHFMLPHEPYVLDETGKFIPFPNPHFDDKTGYLRQLKYCNLLIRQITECLLRDSTRDKIIIFQGDHGYRDYEHAPVVRQFQALNAIYFYDGNYNGMKKDMSHVNTYRVILNKYFGTDLPMLKDSIVIKGSDKD